FFSQAEDGIRDRNVTGVQTCALPISRRLRLSSTPGPGEQDPTRCRWTSHSSPTRCCPWPRPTGRRRCAGTPTACPAAGPRRGSRSEERREGKECGDRVLTDQTRLQDT